MEKNEYSSPVMESAGGGTPQTIWLNNDTLVVNDTVGAFYVAAAVTAVAGATIAFSSLGG
jgi:hypothetical protein